MPKWNFDGSSTDQAPGDDSEVILRPCRIFKDPFRPRSDGVDNILVMCDTYTPAGEPLPTNSRAKGKCMKCMNNHTGATEFVFFIPAWVTKFNFLVDFDFFVLFRRLLMRISFQIKISRCLVRGT